METFWCSFFRIRQIKQGVSDNFNTELLQIISILSLSSQEIINPYYVEYDT